MKFLHYALAAGLLVSSTGARADSALYTSVDYAHASQPAINAWCSSCNGSQIIGDRFTLSDSSQLTSTDFAIRSSYGSQWQIHIGIYDVNLRQLSLSTALPGAYTLTPLEQDVTLVHAALPALTLAAGAYYITWWDDRAMGIAGYTVGGSATEFNFSQGTEIGNYGAAFRINGVSGVSAVAEPASYAMLLAGLGLLGSVRRRSQRCFAYPAGGTYHIRSSGIWKAA